MNLSVIIPTYNEATTLPTLLERLILNTDSRLGEILVIDGGSEDDTLALATAHGATKALQAPHKGRASQMNYGATLAQGDVLYFVHADTIPPASYVTDIADALQKGNLMGCYRYQFNSPSSLLKINAYCTRFDKLMCRGGDQTFFITADLFSQLEGYKESYCIMEEYEFIRRARKVAPFYIIPKDALVSARKYDHNCYLQVNAANLMVFLMFFMGCSPKKMASMYKKLLN
ncbi:MAG: TIGR04283 family arsenosugar biosynthesis glycosyltransferase [Bacteroidota bacterium]